MRTIHKFPVPLTDRFHLDLPPSAVVLSVQAQMGSPQMWILLDNSQSVVSRKFRVFGTGHPVLGLELKFIGTFQLHDGALVLHLFEEV